MTNATYRMETNITTTTELKSVVERDGPDQYVCDSPNSRSLLDWWYKKTQHTAPHYRTRTNRRTASGQPITKTCIQNTARERESIICRTGVCGWLLGCFLSLLIGWRALCYFDINFLSEFWQLEQCWFLIAVLR